MDLVQKWGTKWSKIVKMLPGRSDNAIKNRWNSTMRKNLRRQLKEGGTGLDANVGRLLEQYNTENLPVRKRGSATSAEVATAAAAAAVKAAAQAAGNRGLNSPRSPRSPNKRKRNPKLPVDPACPSPTSPRLTAASSPRPSNFSSRPPVASPLASPAQQQKAAQERLDKLTNEAETSRTTSPLTVGDAAPVRTSPLTAPPPPKPTTPPPSTEEQEAARWTSDILCGEGEGDDDDRLPVSWVENVLCGEDSPEKMETETHGAVRRNSFDSPMLRSVNDAMAADWMGTTLAAGYGEQPAHHGPPLGASAKTVQSLREELLQIAGLD